MAVLREGKFTLNLGVVKMEGALGEEDRQCAWELFTELSTRVALVGKANDDSCTDFTGEVYAESLDSVYRFFQEARGIMRKFPVGRLEPNLTDHLGYVIGRSLFGLLRPFLERWNAPYRHWWLTTDSSKSPFERQREFPDHDEFIADWTAVRKIMRHVNAYIAEQYKLPPLG